MMRIKTKLGCFTEELVELCKMDTLVINKKYVDAKGHDNPYSVKLYLNVRTALGEAITHLEEVEGLGKER